MPRTPLPSLLIPVKSIAVFQDMWLEFDREIPFWAGVHHAYHLFKKSDYSNYVPKTKRGLRINV